MSSVAIRHIGLCVADIDASSHFYREGLGFEPLMEISEIGAPFDTLIEQPGATLRVQQLRCGDVTIELLGFKDVAVTGAGERGAMNARGFTHLTLVVDDVDAVAARIVDLGGNVHPETRVDSDFGPLVFCTDPDGVRIELMQGGS
ncbi:MAG: VOC family protein [Halioglobus sp.]|nr:VOC family protein [Halioglobus sp.]